MKPTAAELDWLDLNQRHLVAALAEIQMLLERHAGGDFPETAAVSSGEGPTSLETLCSTFGLSRFERSVLLLCAGMELNSSFGPLCARAQRDPAFPYPTFSLALAAFPDPHWSALTPAAPLRRWRLIETAGQSGAPLTSSPLRIHERVLHYLTGLQYIDDRVASVIEPVRGAADLVPSHRAIASQIARSWLTQPAPLIQLCGGDEETRRWIAAAACAEVRIQLYSITAENIPAGANELDGLVRLWEREAALAPGALYVDAAGLNLSDLQAAGPTARFLDRVGGACILGVRDRSRPFRRPMLTFDVRKPTAEEQRVVWQTSLGPAVEQLNGHLPRLVSHFNLNVSAIQSSARAALASGSEQATLGRELWDATRLQARPVLDDLAQRIEPVATWEDLVLPDAECAQLRQIATHVCRRSTVYGDWGFAAAGNRGLGISALFAGPSGTGKTMAAEVLANDLRLDLYRIDLSCVVSKYIGETEKNLRRVFDAAEEGGVILFFDEADALFGKRSEVKDSHDRYANIEINYLLQRMESYRGLAVLATNMKTALDPAFMRRLRFAVNFPFPDAAMRTEIWRKAFPKSAPTDGLDLSKLARLDLAGGNIRNVALNAAFLAAGREEPIGMPHIWHAVRSEFAKLEKPLSETAPGGWS